MRVAAKEVGITAASGGLCGGALFSLLYCPKSRFRPASDSHSGGCEACDFAGGGWGARPYWRLMTGCSMVERRRGGWVAEPMPRVVFGGVPTLQDARETTSELTTALDKTYLSSPNSVGRDGSFVVDLPAPVIMAFRFLSESSAAQNVVASVAYDPNV
ncbi:hypothetical protein Sango_2818600 [Sesamum angolense]|uniref:Uncharacterized protein n=1 Tax=Sesamum angolense TaxID=2727404 RepID=A0AAE1VWM8_9LAMI|nr:hypothetical protein Sango_2818600 [Sesamum angolense]